MNEILPAIQQYWRDKLGIAVVPKLDVKNVDFGDGCNPLVAQYRRDKGVN